MKWSNTIRNGLLFALTVAVLTLICQCTSSSVSSDFVLPVDVDFNYHIRPILSQNCYLCHGPDGSSRKANLRLDIYEGATAKLSSGKKAIVPGSASKSEIMKRLMSHDPNYQMPPPETKKEISQKEIALIEKWIDQGAKWKDHWAFIPPNSKTLELNQSPTETIDQLINVKLTENNLSFSPRASSKSLIRRASYTLTGLPPSISEINTFTADIDQFDYEKVVDYYLNSSHFGEHWARHWMDLVRYAEHMGHEFDFPIGGAWQYRDYLIRAFNEDVPYDQFVKEHLAGDLLAKPRLNKEKSLNESIIGTAYAYLGEGKHSPVDIKQEEADRIDNMIDVTSKTFQALTVACAKCHDHKFDPIPTTDYYAMYGMFESSRIGPKGFNLSPLRSKKIEEAISLQNDLSQAVDLQLKLEASNLTDQDIEDLRNYLQDSIKQKYKGGEMMVDFSAGTPKDWIFEEGGFSEQSVKASPFINDQKVKRLSRKMATSRSISKGQLGKLRSQNFIIQDSFLQVTAAGKGGTIRVIVENFQLIQNPLYGNLEKKINDDYLNDYLFDISFAIGRKAYIEIMPGVYERHEFSIEPDHYIDVEKIETFSSRPADVDSFEYNIDLNDLKVILGKSQRSSDEVNILNYWLRAKGGLDINEQVNNINNKQAELAQELYDPYYFMGLSEGPEVFSPVFVRGSIDQLSKEKVPHQFLAAISKPDDSFPQSGSGRLQWAESVASSENPLTSRVMVNRIWHHLFGKGIVSSVDNFGLQGVLPTHPELLDYLALQFIKDGWSVKQLIRNIMLSETFQRATIKEISNGSTDPNNDFYHHFPVRRLEAESIRDGILSIAGSLTTEMYGPPEPIHLTEFMNGRGRPSASGALDGNGRRSIYLSIRRNFLSPMMLAFDLPIPFSTFGKRNTTNVPAQSLTLMNDPFVHDQANKWAKNLIEMNHKSIDERLEIMFLSAFARSVTPQEIEEAKILIQQIAVQFEIPEQGLMKNEILWKEYCHVIINAKEFIHLL